jgi:EAL domain-containing protein (putative c-di-GMP-specific phosphodiesterase class I)
MEWLGELGADCPQSISVNISDRLFASRGFAGSLGDLLRRIEMRPERLQLEITETVFRGNYAETLSILRDLKELNVRLLVDDFGTGYSSLVSFTEAAFDGLKIDRGFVNDLETNPRHRALVKTICQFARDLQMSVTCEGVERSTQASILDELGCTQAQGFKYAPAVCAKQFVERVLFFRAASNAHASLGTAAP